MIDTIRIESPVLSNYEINYIESQLVARMAVDMKTGEQIYKFTSDSLDGSYDSRIMVILDYNAEGERVLVAEGSVHKNLLGQNAVGMIGDFWLASRWFVNLIETHFQIKLPCWSLWKPKRIDYAKVFDLGTTDNVKKYCKGLADLTYPRRQVVPYGHTGIYVNGSTTTIKFYHKGIEFRKHDYSRLKKYFDVSAMYHFQELVNRLLRVEVEIKYRLIKSYYGKTVCCADITENWLMDVWEKEVCKLLKEGDCMRVVRTCDQVKERLFDTYNSRLASILYGTWFMLTSHGEENVKNLIEARTYRRHIKQLKEAGVSWHNTDVKIDSPLIQFVPSLSSDKIVNWVHQDCYKLLSNLFAS